MHQLARAVLLIALVGVAVNFIKRISIAFDKDLRSIPGPWLSRFSNLPLKLAVLIGQRAQYIHKLHQQYGPYVRVAPTEIAIADIKAHRELHRVTSKFTKSDWYHRIDPYHDHDDILGVFGVRDPRKATGRRKLLLQASSKEALAQWEQDVVSIVDQTVLKIKRDATKGKANLYWWFSLMTEDIVGKLAFGETYNMVEKEEETQMVKDLQVVMMFAGLYAECSPIWPIIGNLPIPKIGRPALIIKRMNEAGNVAVRNTKAAIKGSTRTLFSKMYQEDSASDIQPLSDTILGSEAINLMVAGKDTTSVLLTYLVYEVLRHSAVKEKLLREVASCSANPDWRELESKPYLNHVLSETLRLHPPIPGSLPRSPPPEGAVLGGYCIPANCTVFTQALDFHYDATVFPDPESFDPDRWATATPEMKEHLMPFGGTARYCVGVNIARLEMLHTVARLFRAMPDAKLADTTTAASMDWLDTFMMIPKGKCEIVMREAK